MFKWIKNIRRKTETLNAIDTVQHELMASVINQMMAYECHFSYPRNTPPVSARQIILDLENAGYDIPSLIYDITSGRLRVPDTDGCRITLVKKW
jgi:hypothetical protein